jgi:hypothetical protein
VYHWFVKKSSATGQTRALASTARLAFRRLKKYVRELRALLIEARSILDRLLRNPAVKIVRRLCSRYHALQEHFVVLYAEARNCAVAALGTVEAELSFPT